MGKQRCPVKNNKKKDPQKQMKIGYARISTHEQNLDLQIDALRSAGCEKWFTDEGISGVTEKRPALDLALNHLQPGDVLVTWKLDRLGRSLAHLIQLLCDLEKRDIGFQSLSETIDTTTAGGRLIFHMMAALAEFERSLISERTKAGLEAAKQRGVIIGRPKLLSQKQVADAKKIMASEVVSLSKLAQVYGVSAQTLSRAVKQQETIEPINLAEIAGCEDFEDFETLDEFDE